MKPTAEELSQLVVAVVNRFNLESSGAVVSVKSDGSFVTEMDSKIQSTLKNELNSLWPQYGFIGEEMSHSEQRDVVDYCDSGYWVLDPLDGTTNYANGFLFFGVSLALVENSQTTVAVVYDPIRDECFRAEAGGGAYLNNIRLTQAREVELANCLANVDYKRLMSDLAERLVRSPPYRSQRNLGSSVLEWSWLACGRIQLYLHGGQKLWDFAAGLLILRESGGSATSLSGQSLGCGKLRKRSIVAAGNPELLEKWESWIASNTRDSDIRG
ncbi:MAG: inositol monophosphatase [Pseudomonadota bacterium]